MLLSRVSLSALRTFSEVARCRSLSQAAERLCISPSAVSHQMKLLEQQLETPLLQRRSRGIELTNAGARLAEFTCNAMQQLEQGLNQASRKPRKELRIAAIPALLQLWLLPRLERFYQQFPNIELHLLEQDKLADFSRQSIDLHLHFGSGESAGLESRLLMNESVIAVCSPKLRRAHGSDASLLLSDHTRRLCYSGFEEDSPGGLNWQGWFNQARLTINHEQPGSHFNHLAPLYQAAMRGHGFAPGWSQLVKSMLESGELVQLTDTAVPLKFSYYAVAPAHHFERRNVAEFMDWLRSELN